MPEQLGPQEAPHLDFGGNQPPQLTEQPVPQWDFSPDQPDIPHVTTVAESTQAINEVNKNVVFDFGGDPNTEAGIKHLSDGEMADRQLRRISVAAKEAGGAALRHM